MAWPYAQLGTARNLLRCSTSSTMTECEYVSVCLGCRRAPLNRRVVNWGARRVALGFRSTKDDLRAQELFLSDLPKVYQISQSTTFLERGL